jgi:hypothetical protein
MDDERVQVVHYEPRRDERRLEAAERFQVVLEDEWRGA